MPLQITSDNLEITPSMKTLAESKIARILNKLTDVSDLIDLRAVLNKGSADETFSAKIELSIGKNQFVSENDDFTLESALIGSVDDVLRQYEKVKSKRTEEEWEGRRKMKLLGTEESEEIA